MNRLCLFLLGATLFVGIAPAAQTDDADRLAARVKELEAENQQLKQAIAKKGIGSLGIPYGQVVTIDGEFDPMTPIKSVFTYRVTAINGKKLGQDVHVYTFTPEWARSKGTPGKSPRKLLGFQCLYSVGSNQTGLALQTIDTFMIIDVLDEK